VSFCLLFVAKTKDFVGKVFMRLYGNDAIWWLSRAVSSGIKIVETQTKEAQPAPKEHVVSWFFEPQKKQ